MNNKLKITIFSILTIISFMIGFSYAYFTTIVIGNETASTHKVVSGKLELTYDGTNFINMNNAVPNTTKSATFTVKNTGTLPIDNYQVYFSKIVNTFINNEVVYTLGCISSDSIACNGVPETPVPTSEVLMLTQPSINPNTTHTYTLSVKFIEAGIEQNYNQQKTLSFMLTINEMQKNMIQD